jgi:hypothetical protein
MLLPFGQFQTIVPLAAWLAPIFLLRFSRTQRALIALPVLALGHRLPDHVARTRDERGLGTRIPVGHAAFERHSLTAVLLTALVLGGAWLAFFNPTVPTVRVAALAADRALRDSDQQARVIDDLMARTRLEAQAGARIVSWSEAAASIHKEDEAALAHSTRGSPCAPRAYLLAAGPDR